VSLTVARSTQSRRRGPADRSAQRCAGVVAAPARDAAAQEPREAAPDDERQAPAGAASGAWLVAAPVLEAAPAPRGVAGRDEPLADGVPEALDAESPPDDEPRLRAEESPPAGRPDVEPPPDEPPPDVDPPPLDEPPPDADPLPPDEPPAGVDPPPPDPEPPPPPDPPPPPPPPLGGAVGTGTWTVGTGTCTVGTGTCTVGTGTGTVGIGAWTVGMGSWAKAGGAAPAIATPTTIRARVLTAPSGIPPLGQVQTSGKQSGEAGEGVVDLLGGDDQRRQEAQGGRAGGVDDQALLQQRALCQLGRAA
jgi:hypothetical protein